MSKLDKASTADVLETSAEYLSGVNNTKADSMSPLDLLKVNVNDHTEKKNNLTYLSWAWGWAEALKADPSATFEVKTFLRDQYTEMPYMDVNGTAMVWVTVTMFGQPRICMLPVMNHRNQPIPNPDAFQVNTAIMRCMTKCLALHGLGLYIYAGEDLPEEDTPAPVEKAAPTPRAPAPKRPQPTEWDNSDASRTLFAEGMIEYASHCTNKAGLNSYWKSNQLQIDSLKQTHPDLYTKVLNHFTNLKTTFESNT